MSDPTASATDWTSVGHYGASPPGVMLAEATFTAAWNIQGDASRAPFGDEASRLFAFAPPTAPNTTVRRAPVTALWLGPTSWLIVATEGSTLTDFAARRDALNAAGGALFDVTASSIGWSVGGPRAATVLAKNCPLDFHARAFADGACAQSVLGHVNALYYRRSPELFTLLVARSYARGAWKTLCQSALQYGYDVLPPFAF